MTIQLFSRGVGFFNFCKYCVLLFFVAVSCYFIANEYFLKRPEKLFITSSGSVDMCLSCHRDEKLNPAHDSAVMGCSPCHLGNPLVIDKKLAHKGMVLNPGDLRHVKKTCGVDGCHGSDVHKVKNSLMATNRGIIGTLLYYWGESTSQDSDLTVEQLINSDQTSLALDYFRKLCGTCHLWKQKNDLPDTPQFFNDKGGGCSACHSYYPDRNGMESVLVGDSYDQDGENKKIHPLIIKKVRSSQCIRCHNRSGRIGISYMGIFESEGYGTPFEEGEMNGKQLPGSRFYLKIADDIHHKKGMECIDCHSRDEIMGDGTSYAHYEEQVEISCRICHSSSPGLTRKNNRLNNIKKVNDKTILVGKIDGGKHPLNNIKKGVCDFPAHKRVSCEACHSTWVAQCYGCHAKRDERLTHLDKLSHKETPGYWQEGRSYIRYSQPMLGVWKDEIVVVTPGCQDIVTVVDGRGKIEQSFNRFTMAAINPHTTQAKGRKCIDCHASTRTVGLGLGTIVMENGKMVFVGVDRGVDTNNGRTVAFDSYVDIDGNPLQNSSRENLRPFNGRELQAVLRVGLCVTCHNSYTDRIWKDYTAGSVCSRQNNELSPLGQEQIRKQEESHR